MQQPTITLTVQQGLKRGQRFSVAKDSIVIGRMMGNDVVISDPEVSRRHASITWERGQPILRDLGSTNGTFVNDVRLTRPQALSDGDTIGLGKVQLGFQCPALAGARPTVARPSPPPAYAPPPAPPAEVEGGAGGFSWTALALFGLAVVILLAAAAVGAYFYTQRGEQVAGVPTVVINSPPSGSQVSVGQEVVVQATATDSRGVTRVELLVNGVLYHSDASLNPQGQSPFISRQSWQASAAGTYTLIVKAYNAAGGVSQPAVININVTGAATPTPGEPTATLTPGQPTATPTMTSTPVPDTPTATWTPVIIVVTETPTPTPTVCTLDAAFVADVTVPDGTVFEPGARIDKIWRIRNSGSCPWQSGYTWVFVSGDQMGADASQAVPATAAGGNVDIGVTMYAPAAPGTYTGYWRMKSSDGQVFGQTSSVNIVVSSPATPTATPTSTPLPGAEISLTVDRDHINAGECTWVRARVEYVRAAWLDGEPLIGGYKEKQVCPCNDTTYTLHVELTDGSTTDRTVTVRVSGVCPSSYDLYVKRMDFSPANPAVIDTISLSIMIATDTYPSGGPFFPASHFRWRKGPGFDWQEEFCPENTQYASCAKTVTFKYSQVGWYDVEVQADNRNEVAETDEGNNVKVWTLTVSP
jgi:predicted RecA/RadA family phage recombinase